MSVRVGVAEERKAAAIQEIKAAMKTNKNLRMHEGIRLSSCYYLANLTNRFLK